MRGSTRLDLASVERRLTRGQAVRRSLPGWGRLHVDRRLPFLCVYRRTERADEGTERLVLGEAAYLRARASWSGLVELVEVLRANANETFGAFLLLEVWAAERSPGRPVFTVFAEDPDTPVVRALVKGLTGRRVAGKRTEVEVESGAPGAPPGLAPLAGNAIGVAVPPVYRDAAERLLPAVLSQVQRVVARSFKQACFVFAKEQTTHRPRHWQALGRRAVTRAVWNADKMLAEVSRALDFLLMVTPVNTESAWTAFKKSGESDEPVFRYRHWPVDPPELLGTLFQVPVQRIEDPTLRDLFEQKRIQLERKIGLLRDRGTPAFLFGSLALYGGVDDELLAWALRILAPGTAQKAARGAKKLDAEALATRARLEIEHYQERHPSFTAEVKVRRDVTGLMASHGNLLIGASTRVSPARAEALLHHEIGTHLLCYYNASIQPFQILRMGLPGYEELQEGLALLAEYLCGGLSRARVRVLAGRVLAVRRTCEQRTFKELFEELRAHDFDKRTAFNLCMRARRGGGFTKDACYLRGLKSLLDALGDGIALESLYIGKIAIEHVGIIKELHWRGVLKPVPLLPRFLDDEAARARLAELRSGTDPVDLLEGTA